MFKCPHCGETLPVDRLRANTKSEAAYKMRLDGLPYKEIKVIMGWRSEGSVHQAIMNFCDRRGLPRPYLSKHREPLEPPPKNTNKTAWAYEMRARGHAWMRIATALGWKHGGTWTSARRYADRNGLKWPPLPAGRKPNDHLDDDGIAAYLADQ